MPFIQLYSVVMTVLLDLVCVFRLCVLRLPLSAATLMWFDRDADSPQGSLLLAVLLVYFAVAKLLVAYEPLSRWALLLTSIGETVRLVLFSVFFSNYEGATEKNTMALTFLGFNAYCYWWNWNSMNRMFSKWSK